MTTAISDRDLEWMRAEVENLLPSTCHILSVTRTSDSAGGWTEAWGTVTANVACRVDDKSGDEAVYGAAVQPYNHYVITLPHDTTVAVDYRIKTSTDTYSVKAVNTDQSWKACIRVEAERL